MLSMNNIIPWICLAVLFTNHLHNWFYPLLYWRVFSELTVTKNNLTIYIVFAKIHSFVFKVLFSWSFSVAIRFYSFLYIMIQKCLILSTQMLAFLCALTFSVLTHVPLPLPHACVFSIFNGLVSHHILLLASTLLPTTILSFSLCPICP